MQRSINADTDYNKYIWMIFLYRECQSGAGKCKGERLLQILNTYFLLKCIYSILTSLVDGFMPWWRNVLVRIVATGATQMCPHTSSEKFVSESRISEKSIFVF